MTPLLESIEQAMAWEQHKYRSKQHIYRLHLHGRNTVTAPWRLPPLPPQLRRLMSEREYHRLSGAPRAASLQPVVDTLRRPDHRAVSCKAARRLPTHSRRLGYATR
eukprot:4031320-Prymnesium_polylepis.1